MYLKSINPFLVFLPKGYVMFFISSIIEVSSINKSFSIHLDPHPYICIYLNYITMNIIHIPFVNI